MIYYEKIIGFHTAQQEMEDKSEEADEDEKKVAEFTTLDFNRAARRGDFAGFHFLN